MRHFNVEGRQAASLLLLCTEERNQVVIQVMVQHMRMVVLSSQQNGQLIGLWSSTTTMSPIPRRRDK
eukprot:7512236-Ditylum_brightwellii.AAC.1